MSEIQDTPGWKPEPPADHSWVTTEPVRYDPDPLFWATLAIAWALSIMVAVGLASRLLDPTGVAIAICSIATGIIGGWRIKR